MGLGDAERAAASFTEHDVDGDGSIDKGGLCWPGAPACWVLRLDDANAIRRVFAAAPCGACPRRRAVPARDMVTQARLVLQRGD